MGGLIVRPLERRDRDDIIANYYSYQKEIAKNKHFGVSSLPKLPTIKEEHKWFGKLFASVKEGNSIASVAVVKERTVGLCTVQRKEATAETLHIGTLGIAIKKEFRGRPDRRDFNGRYNKKIRRQI